MHLQEQPGGWEAAHGDEVTVGGGEEQALQFDISVRRGVVCSVVRVLISVVRSLPVSCDTVRSVRPSFCITTLQRVHIEGETLRMADSTTTSNAVALRSETGNKDRKAMTISIIFNTIVFINNLRLPDADDGLRALTTPACHDEGAGGFIVKSLANVHPCKSWQRVPRRNHPHREPV